MKFAMTVAAVAALLLIATQGANADEVNGQMCQDEFNDRSPARNTCIQVEVRHAGGDRCRLKGRCENRGGRHQDTEITVRYDHLYRLNNCNGRFKDGSC